MNQLTKTDISNKIVTYQAGDSEVKLSPSIIKNYLVSGDSRNVTDQEVVMFLNLCKFQKLNPFLREAYLVKFGSQPATLITGKAAFESRAERSDRYEGFKAGVVVQSPEGILTEREGTIVLKNETLIGGWCRVYVRGYKEPVYADALLSEYHTGKSVWTQKPATMIRKVAKVHALREAFPNALEGCYTADELGVDENVLPVEQVEQSEVVEEPAPAQEAEPVKEPEILDGTDFLF